MTVALVAVQLALGPDDVVTPDVLRDHLAAAVEDAVAGASAAAHRLIVLPEAIGLAALVAHAPPRARDAATLAQLIARSALGRPLSVLRGALDARTLEPRHAALVGLAPDVERWIASTFARLARHHRAHVVAGSHLRVDDRGEVVAASATFGPDGRLLATTDKVNLLPGLEDRARGGLGLARADAHAQPRIPTPFGPLAVLAGYDAFIAADSPAERFTPVPPIVAARGGVAVVANPAASPWRWDAPYACDGEAGASVPMTGGAALLRGAAGAEVTCADRWRTRGLAAAMAAGPVARWGVTAHLVGRVLDLAFAGESEIVRDREGSADVVARAGQWERGGAVSVVAEELG
jgi:predicted amidohydrolase